jgi:hypothetical protein
MKKQIVVIVSIVLASLAITSCGSSEKCPAYGTIEQPAELDV